MVQPVRWSSLSDGPDCQMVQPVRWFRLSEGPAWQMVQPVRWSRLPDGSACQIVLTVRWVSLSDGPACQMVQTVRWFNLSDGSDWQMVQPDRWSSLSDKQKNYPFLFLFFQSDEWLRNTFQLCLFCFLIFLANNILFSMSTWRNLKNVLQVVNFYFIIFSFLLIIIY